LTHLTPSQLGADVSDGNETKMLRPKTIPRRRPKL